MSATPAANPVSSAIVQNQGESFPNARAATRLANTEQPIARSPTANADGERGPT
jgi:hypothetical protein